MSMSAACSRPWCSQQFLKLHGSVLLLLLFLLLSSQSAALAGSMTTIKSGSQINQQPQDRRTPPQIETGYAKMHWWDECRQKEDKRAPMTVKPPSSGGSGSGGGSSAASAGSGSGGSGG